MLMLMKIPHQIQICRQRKATEAYGKKDIVPDMDVATEYRYSSTYLTDTAIDSVSDAYINTTSDTNTDRVVPGCSLGVLGVPGGNSWASHLGHLHPRTWIQDIYSPLPVPSPCHVG